LHELRIRPEPAAFQRERNLLGQLLWYDGDNYARELPPVASSPNERDASWRAAAKAFAAKLEMKNPGPPSVALDSKRYREVLMIHSQALLTVTGTRAETKAAILRHLLAREREYRSRCLESQRLPMSLLPAVEQAVYQIGLVNGVSNRQAALRRLAKVRLLEGQPPLVLEQMVTMLRECYPEGQSGIGPLQPDSLKEFLVRRCQGITEQRLRDLVAWQREQGRQLATTARQLPLRGRNILGGGLPENTSTTAPTRA